jgi:glycyl-tRNA synthetase
MVGLSIEDMATFCKKKGFVYQNSEIYGSLAGFWDYGHLGVELKNNLKSEWWKYHVQGRQDIVGIDGSIITHPKVWEASGHVENFEDIMLTCSKCREKVRADHFIDEKLKINVEGQPVEKINSIIKKNKLKCQKCNSEFKDINKFNLMFKTNVGPKEGSSSYLRPETAQVIFTDFKLIVDNARLKLPFGIAQVGKAFRNEISPRDFLFRCREFEMMEIEYFVDPEKADDCPFIKNVLNHELNVYSSEMQEKNQKHKKIKIKDALAKKIIKTQWHAYWLTLEHKWFTSLGANKDNFRIRQHLKDEKSHYALDTWDLEYNFPFGWKELQGIANRTDFDLKQHMKHSGQDLSLFDEESKKKIVPHVIAEPSQGVDRAFLVFMFDAYDFDKKRGNVVLKLHPKLAPIKVGVFPLVSNKPQVVKKAKEVYNELKSEWNCIIDFSGSVGRRYSRQDESGTPLCCTLDFQSLKDDTATLRDRDTTNQIRVKIKDIISVISRFMNGEKFNSLGKKV